LHAWTTLLSGNSAEIENIRSMPWDFDPITKLKQFEDKGRNPKEPRRGWHNLSVWGWILYIIRLLWRQFTDPEEERIICVPKKFLAERKAEIMTSLAKEGSNEWVGSSDVLTAWWFKLVLAHRKDHTPVFMHLAINLRPLSSLNLFSNNTPYINYAVSGVPVPPLSASSFASISLRSLSLRIRKAIFSFVGDGDELRKDLAYVVSNPMKRLLPCTANGDFEIVSNWRAANFNQLDFSGACVNEKDEKSGKTKVTFVLGYVAGVNGPMRGVGFVNSEDDEAIWIAAYRGRKDWEAIRRGGEVAFLG